MEGPLFEGSKFRVVLWHKAQNRVILTPTKELSEAEIQAGNEYYIASHCPDLCYRKANEVEN